MMILTPLSSSKIVSVTWNGREINEATVEAVDVGRESLDA